MKKLAIFDVDYTITSKETLMQLYMYIIKKDGKNIKYLPRVLISGFLYVVGMYDEKRVKECFLKFLENKTKKEIKSLAEDFYNEVLINIFYKDAINKIKELKNKGYRTYLISASPEFYLFELYSIKEVDKIIGTRFQFKDEKFIRKMDGLNCKGEEKVKRLKTLIKEEGIKVDFANSYMFSDSLSDEPLLKLVGNPYLINYKKKSIYKSLSWK